MRPINKNMNDQRLTAICGKQIQGSVALEGETQKCIVETGRDLKKKMQKVDHNAVQPQDMLDFNYEAQTPTRPNVHQIIRHHATLITYPFVHF